MHILLHGLVVGSKVGYYKLKVWYNSYIKCFNYNSPDDGHSSSVCTQRRYDIGGSINADGHRINSNPSCARILSQLLKETIWQSSVAVF